MRELFKGKKHSILIAIVAFVISFVVCVAMFLPTNVGNIYETNGVATMALAQDEIGQTSNCLIKSDGEYIISGFDPQIMFTLNGQYISGIRLNFLQVANEQVPFEIYTATAENGFSAENCYMGSVFKGENSAVISVPGDQYIMLRLDIDEDNGVMFKNIELFEQKPSLTPYKLKHTTKDYFAVAIIPIITAFVMWVINNKTEFCQRAFAWLKKHRMKIIEIFVFVIVAALAAVLAELIISIIAGKDFNVYRWVFILGIAELVVAFIFGFKSINSKPQNIFLPVALIMGAAMLFCSPIKHICWDLDSHYPWAVQNSFLETAYITVADTVVDKNGPAIMVRGDFGPESYESDLAYLNQAGEILASQTEVSFSISHVPSGIVIAIARMFGLDFAVKYNLGRLANLIVYALVCFAGIRKIKSGKMLLAVICLFPTNLFLATNYAYDAWVTAFSILGISYYLYILQEPKKSLRTSDVIIMCAGFALAALPKLVYVGLMATAWFMYKKNAKKKEIVRYYCILMAIFALVFLFFMLRSASSLGGSGDSRGGAVEPGQQVAGILANPFGYIKLLFKFLTGYLSVGTMKEYISHFAYLGIGEHWYIMAVLLGLTALTDCNPKAEYKIPWLLKIFAVAIFAGMLALIASSMYISFTPVGATTINGCQPRYIIPLLAPLLLIVTGKRINLIKNKTYYNLFVLITASIAVMLEIYSVIIIKMI